MSIFWRFFRPDARHRRMLHRRDFFGGKIGIFRFFGEKSTILPIFRRFFDFRLSFVKIFSMPTENRYFGDISAEKSDFFVPVPNKSSLEKSFYLPIQLISFFRFHPIMWKVR